MSRSFSNLASVVYRRTYSRQVNGRKETFPETVERIIAGNVQGHNVSQKEIERLRYFLLNRKAGPAGRGWWLSGAPAMARFGGAALTNCWFLKMDNIEKFVMLQDLMMLGGGVGVSVEKHNVVHLPRVKRGVTVQHKPTRDADYIVPDTREGWCDLTRRTLEAFFVTGKSFSYSTVCIRPYGEPIVGFGGTASGPGPLITLIERLSSIIGGREGRSLRPIDVADVVCSIGEMVVAGNVRRSAIIILGDPWDREYLTAKRWDLGPIPTYRAMANFSVIADDAEHDLRATFWETYKHGEPFGIVNRTNIQAFARMGERKKDTAEGVNPCSEATLEDSESCNLQELNLAALSSPEELCEAARLMHRWGKRVAMMKYYWPSSAEVIRRNCRIGTGITGCLGSPLFTPEILDRAYRAIQEENISYSKQLGINPSIRTTVVKPSGTMSKMMDAISEGIHPAYSRYFIQRIRLASNDPLVPALQKAGHYIEPVKKFDGSADPNTVVADFYVATPDSIPVADDGFDTWHQLNTLLMAQKYWADQAVSTTVYYKEEDLPKIKEWVRDHLCEIKAVSFLKHSGHGFLQAPKEPISKAQYDELTAKIKPLELADDSVVDADLGLECASGACPIK